MTRRNAQTTSASAGYWYEAKDASLNPTQFLLHADPPPPVKRSHQNRVSASFQHEPLLCKTCTDGGNLFGWPPALGHLSGMPPSSLWRRLLPSLVLLAATFPAAAASYTPKENGNDLFERPASIEISIPADGMQILRDYNQVWRQPRPERVDVRATVREGGRTYTNVAVHLKGSYSFQRIDGKPSLTLNFAKFAPGQKFHGLTKIHLNNSVQDSSYLCEALARQIFNDLGIPTPRAGHALVSINGRKLGLSVLVEGANGNWVKRRFPSDAGNLYDGGSGGEITRALETDSGDHPDDRSDLTNLVKAAREPDIQKRHARLGALLDLEQFTTFAALETFLVHWDGYCIGGNNYRLFHDVARGRMVFIPSGMDQLWGVSSSPSLSIMPTFKGLTAKSALAIPAVRQRYLDRLGQLSTNELRVERLFARVNELTRRVRPALQRDAALLDEFDSGVAELKSRIQARAESVAQQLKAPPGPRELPPGQPVRLTSWSYKGGTTVSAAGSRLISNGKEQLRVTGRGAGSTGAWRSTMLLGPGRYEFSGLVRTEGVTAQPGLTNGVILRVSGERSTEGILISEEWKSVRYEFEVQGIETVEFVGEFRGAAGSGYFDAASLRVLRREP